jgi:nitroreductase
MADASFPTTQLDFLRRPDEEMVERSRDFYELMDRRRSVRVFSDEAVPMEVLENAVRVAGTAPSGAHMQPWRFAIVTDAEMKKKIREAAEAEERETYENRMSDEWRKALAPLGTDANKPFLEICPALIVVFRVDYGLDESGGRVKHYYVQESVGIATGMLIAALHNAGLATLTHTPSPMKFLGQVLGRPANEKAFVLLPVGYPAEGCEVPTLTRKPLEDIILRA